MDPKLNGTGRKPDGRFGPGNPGGPGNPYTRKCNELRAAIYDGVSREDMAEMVKALVELAKQGDIQAFRELVPWLLGKPESAELTARIEELETLLREIAAGQNAPRALPDVRATA